MINLVCVRVGDKYSRQYVATLHDMITRHFADPHQFWCITDDPHPIHPDIRIIPADPELPGWWAKISLFNPDMPFAHGERVAYFDLDVCIVGRLEELVETKGIIRDWHVPFYNSSVMVWNHGEHREIWDQWSPGIMHEEYNGDQEYITALDHSKASAMAVEGDVGCDPCWPILNRDWCLSYRSHAQDFPPLGAKVIVFHGHPNPHEVTDGWVPQVWKIGGLTELPSPSHMNVSFEHALNNVRINSARDLPWFVGSAPHKDVAVIVAGGPSLVNGVDAIKGHKRKGAKILALNNAGAFLNWHGIVPDALLVCDARPENVTFIRSEAKRYIIASQCDPALFEELGNADVHLIHLAVVEEMSDLMKPYEDIKPIILIGGGSTVGLRALYVMMLSGYKTIRCYGMDSSYGDGKHHAYDQPINDGDNAHSVFVPALNKHYIVSPWQARQASEYRDLVYPTLKKNNVRVFMHGKGLIPDMHRYLEKTWTS